MQDPLGASEAIVDVANLKLWYDTEVPTYDLEDDKAPPRKESPFPCYKDLNEKIVLW